MAHTRTGRRGRPRNRTSPAAGTLLAWLSSGAFPADRDVLVDWARSRRTPGWLFQALRRLPEDSVYQSAEQLAHALRTQPLVRVKQQGEDGPASDGDRSGARPQADQPLRRVS